MDLKEISKLKTYEVAGFQRKMKTQRKLTEGFGIKRSLRQGDALSTTLFNTVLEKVIRNIETNPNGKIYNSTRQYVANADNVLLLGRLAMAIDVVRVSTVGTGWVIKESKKKNRENKQKYNKFRARSDNVRTCISRGSEF